MNASKCNKHKYSEEAAIELVGQLRQDPAKSEHRHYFCKKCKVFHVTYQKNDYFRL